VIGLTWGTGIFQALRVARARLDILEFWGDGTGGGWVLLSNYLSKIPKT
jgi:hypothetical protein